MSAFQGFVDVPGGRRDARRGRSGSSRPVWFTGTLPAFLAEVG